MLRCAGMLLLPGEAESTVPVLIKRSTYPVTLAKKEDASATFENYASLSNSLPNLGSFPQHCDVPFGLLSGAYSAYFNNMYNFLAIQTCICMQLIELASVFWQ